MSANKLVKTAEKAKARELYAAGLSYGKIKERLGVSLSSVSLWCRDLCDTPRQSPKRKIPPEVKEQARTLYQGGMSCYNIGKQMDMDARRIAVWCDDLVKAKKALFLANNPGKKLPHTSGPQVLTDEMVIKLRDDVRREGLKNWEARAEALNSSRACVRMATLGLTFKHLDEEHPPVTESEARRARKRRGPGKKPKKTQVYVSTVDSSLIQEAIDLRRSDPSTWTYGAVARFLSEKTGVDYRAGPTSVILLARDPSLKELEAIKPIRVPRPKRVKPKPRNLEVLSVAELQKRAADKRRLEKMLADEDAYEAWVNAGSIGQSPLATR